MDRDTRTLLRALDRISDVLQSDNPRGRREPSTLWNLFVKRVGDYVDQVYKETADGVDLSPFKGDTGRPYVGSGTLRVHGLKSCEKCKGSGRGPQRGGGHYANCGACGGSGLTRTVTDRG